MCGIWDADDVTHYNSMLIEHSHSFDNVLDIWILQIVVPLADDYGELLELTWQHNVKVGTSKRTSHSVALFITDTIRTNLVLVSGPCRKNLAYNYYTTDIL
jgi:hypothetical protein